MAVTVPARGNVFLRALRETPTPKSRIELKAERARRQLTAQFDAERERLIGVIGEAEFEELKRTTVERIAAETTEEASVVGYVDLVVNGRDHLITLEAEFGFPEGTVVPLVPYTEFVAKQPPKSGEGGEARGKAAPARDPGRGRARRAPRWHGGGRPRAATSRSRASWGPRRARYSPSSPGGERIVLRVLPRGAAPVRARRGRRVAAGALIERIAAKLAIEPCEYAGGFALMAAATFGGRAERHRAVQRRRHGRLPRAASDAKAAAATSGRSSSGPRPRPAIAFMRHLAGHRARHHGSSSRGPPTPTRSPSTAARSARSTTRSPGSGASSRR